jgi:hypothetical protein
MNKQNKLSQKDINDLCTLIEHVRTDLSYGFNGTYGYGGDESKDEEKRFNQETKATIRAIDIIKKLILTNYLHEKEPIRTSLR